MTDRADSATSSRQFVARVKLGLAEEARIAAAAAQQLDRIKGELVELMGARGKRSWTSQEFERYLALSRSERSCDLTYAMARRRFDVLRRRLFSFDDPSHSPAN